MTTKRSTVIIRHDPGGAVFVDGYCIGHVSHWMFRADPERRRACEELALEWLPAGRYRFEWERQFRQRSRRD